MTLRTQYSLTIVGLIVAFAVGRYSTKIAPNVKTVSQTQVQTEVKADKDVHKETQTVTTKAPDGSEKTVTTVVEDSTTKIDKLKDSQTKVDTTVTQVPRKTLNISALVGTPVHLPGVPIYGVSVSKELLGPVTVGAFGFSSGLVGISLGVSF